MTDEKKESVEKFVDKDSSLQESYAINVLEAFWNAVNINSMDTLVFGNPYCVWFDDEPDLLYGLFPNEQKEKIIDPIFSLSTGVYMLVLIIAMMSSALKMAYSPMGGKSEFQENFFMYIATGVLLAGFWLLAEQIFSINWAIVNAIRDMLSTAGIELGEPFLVASQDDFNFTDIIIMFAEWFIVLFLNFVYMMRSFMIIILLGLGGLAILSLLFATTRSYFGIWIKDFLGAIFMQSIHALYLSIVLLMVSTMDGEGGVIFKLLMLIMFIPISSMLMGMMSMNSGGIAMAAGMTGVNSLAAATRLAKKGMSKGGNGKGKIPGKTPNMGKLKTTGISAVASGGNSKAWTSAKSVFAKSGMVVGGAAGSVLGPGGVMLGGSMGGKVAGAMLQGPRNVAGGVKGISDTMKQAKTAGMKNTLGNLQDRRAYFGNLGESAGAMIGKGGLGRDIGHGLSGVSRQRLFSSGEAGGLAGKSIGELAKENPGAKVSWMQTNAGSGFYMQDNGQMKAISPLGAADHTLAKGETRMMDYQFQQMGYQPDANQQYSMNPTGDMNMQRISDPYIQGAGGGTIQDPRMKGSVVSPDSYFKNSIPNAESRDLSDRFADRVARHQGFV